MGRWLKRPEGSNWGDFGDDDQIGRMNLVTPERRRSAISEAREGIAFGLGLPLDYPKGGMFPGRRPPVLEATTGSTGDTMYDWVMPGTGVDIVNDDRVLLTLQYSTQWDGLSHIGAVFDADGDGIGEHVFYNGYRSDRDFVQPSQGVAPRAIALGIGYDSLMRAIDAQGADVAEGDFLCTYTGYGDLLLRDGERVQAAALDACPGLDGTDKALLDWIDRSGLAAICADNAMVEKLEGVTRCAGKTGLPLHEHCLVKLGIHLGEFWWFGGIAPWLAEHERAHFLLTAPPLNLPGAVGSPATPVGTV